MTEGEGSREKRKTKRRGRREKGKRRTKRRGEYHRAVRCDTHAARQ
jgi:hypothetical protein